MKDWPENMGGSRLADLWSAKSNDLLKASVTDWSVEDIRRSLFSSDFKIKSPYIDLTSDFKINALYSDLTIEDIGRYDSQLIQNSLNAYGSEIYTSSFVNPKTNDFFGASRIDSHYTQSYIADETRLDNWSGLRQEIMAGWDFAKVSHQGVAVYERGIKKRPPLRQRIPIGLTVKSRKRRIPISLDVEIKRTNPTPSSLNFPQVTKAHRSAAPPSSAIAA